MKKKKGLLLVVLVAVLVCLILGMNLYRSISEHAAAEKESKAEAESLANVVKLYPSDTVSKITIDGISFAYSDTWVYAEDATFPLKTSAVQSIATVFQGLTAERTLTAAESLDSYGLAEPVHTITLTDEEGKETTFKVGSQSVDSYYYVMVNDDQTTLYTCTVSGIGSIYEDLYAYAELEDIAGLWNDAAVSITVNADGQKLTYSKTEITETEEETTENGETSTEITTKTIWNIAKNDEASYVATDETAVTNMLKKLAFSMDALLDYNVSDEEVGTYKLDQPIYTIAIEFEVNDTIDTLVIYIADAYDETYHAVMTSQSKNVYLVERDTIAAIADIFEEDYLTEAEETTEEATEDTTTESSAEQ